jgi:hypothetical protein
VVRPQFGGNSGILTNWAHENWKFGSRISVREELMDFDGGMALPTLMELRNGGGAGRGSQLGS